MGAFDGRSEGYRMGAAFALAASLLWGFSTPLSKLLLRTIPPLSLAALLYLGSGIGMGLLIPLRRFAVNAGSEEHPLSGEDIPLFAVSILAGGIVAPAVLMAGLNITPASITSLLLNLEAASTATIAFLFFHRRLERSTLGAIFILTIAASVLSMREGDGWGISAGALLVLLACVLWGLDNNITGMLSVKDPLEIVAIKGCISGCALLLLSYLLAPGRISGEAIAAAILLGAVSYGLSIVLYILAMRAMGAVKACSFFSTSPFAGAGLSILLLRESMDLWFVLALLLMAFGVRLLLQESGASPGRVPVHERDERMDR